MKIPSVFNITYSGRKQIDRIILAHGKSKEINELALTVHCVDDAGMPFDVVQFHRTRHLVHFLSTPR